MSGKQNIELRDCLKRYFGFDSFKGNQEAVIRNVLDGKDTFVLMPTGGGKSLCYQLPALMMDGVAIVISPLIALMKNQVDAMRTFSMEDGVAHFLNSSLNKAAVAKVKGDVLEGKTKLLYFAPESLTKEDNVNFLRKIRISFYAIDEAHCISEWGHDFRPEYRRIRPIINEIGPAPLIALTATATPNVQMDIQKNLQSTAAERVAKNQKDYFLREQMRVIQEELGETAETDDLEEYRRRILDLKLEAEIEKKLLKELSRLGKQPFGSAEGAVLRTYLDVCLELPWNEKTKDVTDVAHAKKVLDEDHYGLTKVKDRILEYLAVRQLSAQVKGGVLCLVGPPGVGKTSLGKSVAAALGRLGSGADDLVRLLPGPGQLLFIFLLHAFGVGAALIRRVVHFRHLMLPGVQHALHLGKKHFFQNQVNNQQIGKGNEDLPQVHRNDVQ